MTMKKINLLLISILLSINVIATNYTIINSGVTFSPAAIDINLGDTVEFSIASIHNVIEVSQPTWESNGNTPLMGGFTLPYGGGELIIATAGIHYYVCGPHASMGMKGIINVMDNIGISKIKANNNFDIRLFPVPLNNFLNVVFTLPENIPDKIQLVDITGRIVYSEDYHSIAGENSISINFSALKPGYYNFVFFLGNESYVEKIIKN